MSVKNCYLQIEFYKLLWKQQKLKLISVILRRMYWKFLFLLKSLIVYYLQILINWIVKKIFLIMISKMKILFFSYQLY